MPHQSSRTSLLIGPAAVERLARATVAVFGVGGVGSFVVEALARAGIGNFVIVDNDLVCITNINRQLIALHSTLGRSKVDVMKERILDINPKAIVETHRTFYLPEQGETLIRKDYDYIVDAIDTVTAKIDIAVRAHALGIPLLSCMGAGNKLDPTRFEVADIFDTSVCPLCKVMRKELKKRGIPALKVVYSKEEPTKPAPPEETVCAVSCVCPKGATRTCMSKRTIPGSISFVPSVAGLIAAGEVIKDLIKTP